MSNLSLLRKVAKQLGYGDEEAELAHDFLVHGRESGADLQVQMGPKGELCVTERPKTDTITVMVSSAWLVRGKLPEWRANAVRAALVRNARRNLLTPQPEGLAA